MGVEVDFFGFCGVVAAGRPVWFSCPQIVDRRTWHGQVDFAGVRGVVSPVGLSHLHICVRLTDAFPRGFAGRIVRDLGGGRGAGGAAAIALHVRNHCKHARAC